MIPLVIIVAGTGVLIWLKVRHPHIYRCRQCRPPRGFTSSVERQRHFQRAHLS